MSVAALVGALLLLAPSAASAQPQLTRGTYGYALGDGGVAGGTIASSFITDRAFTRVVRLSVRGAPLDASIELRCTGDGCPLATLKRTGPDASFTTRLAKAKLRAGSVLELRITAPGTIGRVVRYRARRGRVPTRTTLCLPAGASAPSAC